MATIDDLVEDIMLCLEEFVDAKVQRVVIADELEQAEVYLAHVLTVALEEVKKQTIAEVKRGFRKSSKRLKS